MVRFPGVHRTALLLTVFVALLLAGCAPSVVGKWEGNMAGQNPTGSSLNLSTEFKPDGKFEQKIAMPMGSMTATGTYKTEGNKLITKTEDVAIPTGGKTISGKQQTEQSATFKVEGDKMTMDTGKGKTTLTRAKQ